MIQIAEQSGGCGADQEQEKRGRTFVSKYQIVAARKLA